MNIPMPYFYLQYLSYTVPRPEITEKLNGKNVFSKSVGYGSVVWYAGHAGETQTPPPSISFSLFRATLGLNKRRITL